MTLFKKIMAFTGSVIIVCVLFGILSAIFTNHYLLIMLITLAVAGILFFFSSKAGEKAWQKKLD